MIITMIKENQKQKDNSKIGIPPLLKMKCTNPKADNSFYLKASHIQLFQLIAYEGFLTLQQMNRFYEMITKNHQHISKNTLTRWSLPKKGILSKKTKNHHNMYSLTPWMVDWMIENSFLTSNDIGNRQRNTHNLLLNESICNGIYNAWKTLIDMLRGKDMLRMVLLSLPLFAILKISKF